MLPEPPSLHGRRDKSEGVLLVGDSSAQWEPSAVTTSVCLRYGVFAVLPTSFIIITRKKCGSGKVCAAAANGGRKDHNLKKKKRACER